MPQRLVEALQETLTGWQDDLPEAWRAVLGDVALGFDDCDPSLMLEPWEPIFPTRRGKTFPGAPEGAHMLRAFDDIAPEDVTCLILGQDPYPAPDFATGRAFEAGNVAVWRELDKMFSKSVRAYMQLICAARAGKPEYARSFEAWPGLLDDIESGKVDLEPADHLADRWVSQGVLLLNSSLTLSRFQVAVDPHQSRGHLSVWRPLMLRVLEILAKRNTPLVIIAFGDAATDCLASARLASPSPPIHVISRPHPAFADELLPMENPFVACNRLLEAEGAQPIAW